MCGIVGYVGHRQALPILLDGLERLEYRGYDSVGVAISGHEGITVCKAKGKVAAFAPTLQPAAMKGSTGIGHTRWATHGEPSDVNAHPQTAAHGRIAVVHNGIIENATVLRRRLEADGAEFVSQTDTEVLAHLIARADGEDLRAAVEHALTMVEGTYAIAVLDALQPGCLVVARNSGSVVIGLGEHEHFVASDPAALVRYTERVIYLDDGETATVTAEGYRTFRLGSSEVPKRAETLEWGADTYGKGSHAHFMVKEITEQPEAVTRTLTGRLDRHFSTAHLGGVDLEARAVLRLRHIKLLGCGSAYYAGLAGAHVIERLSRIPSDAEPASEFRYRNPIIEADTLYIALSQSGETLDTLRAVQEVNRKGGRVLGVVNVVGSSIARECGGGVYIHAGPEIAVASTKAFTCTLVALSLIALHLGRIRDLGTTDGDRLIAGLDALPGLIEMVLADVDHIAEVAERFSACSSAMFVGRTGSYAIALEGAQKLKEVSYIHAEAYPASELKHGPLALISPDFPSVVLIPDDELFEKNVSTASEIRSRRGPIIAVGHNPALAEIADEVILVPKSEPELDPILLTIPLQLMAYHAALARGVDIDQPRNLAKSVTVE
jgi:glucosamine--fructose-6-phosphate aminotransferase (isomerizing)